MKHFIKSLAMLVATLAMFSALTISASATGVESIQDVPLYNQNDYSTPYGNGTVKSSGCGITALAMVASYMTDEEVLPDELAEEFGSRRDSNMGRMEYASEQLGLTYTKTFEWDELVEHLENGGISIVLVSDQTAFTSCQHFILLTGITEEGKIMVNDPNGRNYGKSGLKKGFENGFEQNKILCGFQGAWMYEK